MNFIRRINDRKKISFTLVLFILIGVLVYFYGNSIMALKEYKYDVYLGVPYEHWMIVASDETYIMSSNREPTMYFGRGGGGNPLGSGTNTTGDSSGAFPYGIKIRWFSVVENQFWEGSHQFNHEQLTELFNKRFKNVIYQKEDTYPPSFIVNLLPNGLVKIWLDKGANQFLIAEFQAEKTDMDWKEFILPAYGPLYKDYTREKWVAHMLSGEDGTMELRPLAEEVKKNHGEVDVTPWKQRMMTYPWTLTINQPFTIKDYVTRYLNGERYYTYKEAPVKSGTFRPMPYHFFVYVEGADKKLNRFEIELPPEEVIAAFRKLSGEFGLGETELHIELAEDFKSADIYLKNSTDKIVFTPEIGLMDLYRE